TAGLAARFCRRDRGRLREPFPAHALGMDRIGPCPALGYYRLPTQPCEHGHSVMNLQDMACSSSLSPPCQLFLLSRPEHGRIPIGGLVLAFGTTPVLNLRSAREDPAHRHRTGV